MFLPNEFTIETSDREVARALLSAEIDGVTKQQTFVRAIEPEQVLRILVHVASDVAIGVFAAWLYDIMKGRGSEKTRIQSKQIPQNVVQIITLIQNTIQMNQTNTEEDEEGTRELSSHDEES